MTKIYTVDALCGSGKTYAAIRYAIKCATFGEKFAIVQPSKGLIEQSYSECVVVAEQQAAGIGIRRIHSDTSDAGQVKRDIISHLRNGDSGGEILFITHSAFLSMPYWHNSREWNVLFDELPVVDREFTRNVPATHSIVTDHISKGGNDPVYYALTSDHGKALRAIAENRERDDVYEVFRDVAEAVISDHWDVHARKENWDRMMNGDSENGK